MQHYHFVVQPKLGLFFALGLWILGWVSILLRSQPIFPILKEKAVFGFMVDRLFDVGPLAIAAFAGPIGALVFSWKIEVSEQTLIVSKLFGIIRRKYGLHDIRKLSFIPGVRTRIRRDTAKIKLQFCDGLHIKVDASLVSNLVLLWEFLHLQMSSAQGQEVGPA